MSCSAHALASALTVLEKKAQRALVPPSRLFLYYNARALADLQTQNAPVPMRNAIKTLNATGTCDEVLWPYDVTKFADAPPPACYAQATLHAVTYARVPQELDHAKACLAEGFPFVFGVEIYRGPCETATATGHLPMPASSDTIIGGHAVMAAGYDDATQTFLILNSEGPAWGLNGYFTMPYAYITNPELTFDLWTIRTIT